MLLNCFVAATFFPRVRLVLVTFGADEEGLASVARCCEPFVQSGLLMLASGGNAGASWGPIWRDEGLPTVPLQNTRLVPPLLPQKPKSMAAPVQRGEAPAEGAASSTGHVTPAAWPPPPAADELMTWWHASVAKNTAHEVARAVQVHSRGQIDWHDIVINVDCDNIVTPEYIEKVANVLTDNLGAYTMVTASSNQGSLTGRVAVRLQEFLQQGGYDEGCFGTGYQDVDLKNRWNKLRSSA